MSACIQCRQSVVVVVFAYSMSVLFMQDHLLIRADFLWMDIQVLAELWIQVQHNWAFMLALMALAFTTTLRFRHKPVYLVDFACFQAPAGWRVPFAGYMEHAKLSGIFDEKSLEFQRVILERSGLGERTALPPSLRYLPPIANYAAALKESTIVMFDCLDQLFKKTGVSPQEIDILIVNSCLFTPVPSLSAILVNKYGMRENIKTYNLSGMGCAAGIIGVDLAKNILQTHLGVYALLVNADNISLNSYFGNSRPMLIPNCLFRVGGAAILLSNKSSVKRRSKYQLMHTLRTITGADDKAYFCVYEQEDKDGQVGVTLGKELMVVAGDALTKNITALGVLVLPISEKLTFASNFISRKFFNPNLKPYVPDFKKAFEHFCIHAGGKAVIQELEKNLQLTPEQSEASRMTLYRFGNTSASSTWYELAYSEAKWRVKRGDRVWQIGLGSGFKCNSAVWRALRSIEPKGEAPWGDCINDFPVEVRDVEYT